MGEYLSTPKKDKNPVDGQNATVRFDCITSEAEVWRLRDAGLEEDHGGCSCHGARCH